MQVKISPHKLSGLITAPVSKSEAHRLLICAALSDSPVKLFIGNDTLSDDIRATIDCLKILGAKIVLNDGGFLEVTPINVNKIPENLSLDCKESGSTLRFLLPVAATLCEKVSFKGSGRLPERPITELIDAIKSHGVDFSSNHLPFETSGKLQSGTFELPGNVSSQYISGLMLALPILGENSKIKLTSSLKSGAYVNITISSLEKFGINVKTSNDTYTISGNFKSPDTVSAGGDWSGAAFFLTAGALSGPVSVTGLSVNSAQGDKKILDILRSMGAGIKVSGNVITVCPPKSSSSHRHIEIDIDQTPDLLPVLAIAASCLGCEAKFYNASRLRLKESDRISSTASIIRALGGSVTESSSELFVNGDRKLSGGFTKGFHDHRIVMAAAVAGVKCSNDVIITDAESAKKSYPEFFRDYASLGGRVNVI